jgi:hypothetical protein
VKKGKTRFRFNPSRRELSSNCLATASAASRSLETVSAYFNSLRKDIASGRR